LDAYVEEEEGNYQVNIPIAASKTYSYDMDGKKEEEEEAVAAILRVGALVYLPSQR
jgi:hypothetical protein